MIIGVEGFFDQVIGYTNIEGFARLRDAVAEAVQGKVWEPAFAVKGTIAYQAFYRDTDDLGVTWTDRLTEVPL